MNDETYNGWTNRETWAVALHINNDQGWQESVLELVRELSDLHRGDRPLAAEVGETLRDHVEDFLDPWADSWGERGDHATIGIDLFRAIQDIGSLWRVNWTELGASFLEDLEDN